MKYWWFEDWLLFWVAVIVVPTIAFFIYDFSAGHSNEFTGKIHEMTFVHGNESTTIGMAFTGKGAAPLIAQSGHPDEWSVIVATNDTYVKIECSANQYYHHEIGDEVNYTQDVGRITGIVYSTQLK